MLSIYQLLLIDLGFVKLKLSSSNVGRVESVFQSQVCRVASSVKISCLFCLLSIILYVSQSTFFTLFTPPLHYQKPFTLSITKQKVSLTFVEYHVSKTKNDLLSMQTSPHCKNEVRLLMRDLGLVFMNQIFNVWRQPSQHQS